jgi:ubiquinone/menaquinone biosynthesis C-methylase UbiE
MHTKPVTFDDFKGHPHPASKLFRIIELMAVYNNTKGHDFKQPSMDLGCGDGYLSSILFDEHFTYGIDNGEANDVHIAIEKKLYDKVLIESAEKMSLPDESLNFVFCNSVIEHIPDNEAVLHEVGRTLKKGGSFVFTSPSDKFKEYLYLSNVLSSIGLGFLGTIYKEKRNNMLNHFHTYGHEEWTRRLAKYGMKVIKHSYYISKETNMFWDKIALETRIRGLFDKKAEDHVYEKYKNKIDEYYRNDHVADDRGASLFIWAEKI